MSTSLKKFFGQQAASNKDMIDVSSIKVEACLTTEDVNYLRNRSGRNSGYRGNRGGYRGHGNYSGRPSTSSYRGGDNWEHGTFRDKRKGANTNTVNKPINPGGPDGQPLRCLSCDSVRHLMK